MRKRRRITLRNTKISLWNCLTSVPLTSITRTAGTDAEVSYPQNDPPIQHSPSVHPTAVSPRKLFQLRTRSGVNGLPAVRAVKRIREVVDR